MTVVIMMVMITTDTITTGIEVKDVGGAGYSPHRRDFPRWTRLLPRSPGLYNERMQLRRMNLYTVGLVAGLACGAVMPGSADPAPAEPTREGCKAAVAQTRALAAALPAEDLSRYFAERDLHQAMIEAGNSEFDDCLELAARATEEIRERRHVLQPGERLNVLKSDE